MVTPLGYLGEEFAIYTMELKDFIKSTISQIIDSVSDLNEVYKDKDATINPLSFVRIKDMQSVQTGSGERLLTNVEFDLTVSIDESKNTDGKVNVMSCVIGGGASKSHTEGNSSISRVRFSIPVVLPAKRITSK